MRVYHFDRSRWPILVVVQDPAHTEEDFDAYLRQLEAIYARGERYVYVEVLPATMELPPFARIKRMVAWFHEYRNEALRLCIGSASVVPNAAARGAANFFVEMTKSPVPRYFAKDLDDALLWANHKLAADLRPEARLRRGS